MVRIYRDCSIADLAFRMAFTVFCAYYAFQSTTSLAVCEELSRHAQLIQDLADTGLSTDNCERWFERAAMASVGILALVNIVRVCHSLLSTFSFLFPNTASAALYHGHIPLPSTPLSIRTNKDYEHGLAFADTFTKTVTRPAPSARLPSSSRQFTSPRWHCFGLCTCTTQRALARGSTKPQEDGDRSMVPTRLDCFIVLTFDYAITGTVQCVQESVL